VIALLALVPQLLFKPQQRILRVGSEGLQTTIGKRSGKFTWRDIAREGNCVIVTARNLNAFIVPTSAFPNAVACDEAIAQWQEWHHAASVDAANRSLDLTSELEPPLDELAP
jgi:hypothetical protein